MANITMYHQYREGLEYNPERDAWPQELEEYTCTQIEQENSKPCLLEKKRNLYSKSLEFKEESKLAAEISSWKGGKMFLKSKCSKE